MFCPCPMKRNFMFDIFQEKKNWVKKSLFVKTIWLHKNVDLKNMCLEKIWIGKKIGDPML